MAEKSQLDVEIRTTADTSGARMAAASLDAVATAGQRTTTNLRQTGAAADRAGSQMAGGSRNAALGFLELSRAVEDAQYGLRGVLNNIPTMLMSFGAGAGLAGVVSLAAVAVSTLGSKFLDFGAAAREASKEAEKLGESLKAAADKQYEASLKGNVDAQKEQIALLKEMNSELAINAELLERRARLAGQVANAKLRAAEAAIDAGSGTDEEKLLRKSALREGAAGEDFGREQELLRRLEGDAQGKLDRMLAQREAVRRRKAEADAAAEEAKRLSPSSPGSFRPETMLESVVNDPNSAGLLTLLGVGGVIARSESRTPQEIAREKELAEFGENPAARRKAILDQVRATADLKSFEDAANPEINKLRYELTSIRDRRAAGADIFAAENERRTSERDATLIQMRKQEAERANRIKASEDRKRAQEEFERTTGAAGLEGFDLAGSALLDPNAPPPRTPRTRADQARARANATQAARRSEIDTALRQVQSAFGATRDGATESEITRLLDAIDRLSKTAAGQGTAFIGKIRQTAQRIETMVREHDARLRALEGTDTTGN